MGPPDIEKTTRPGTAPGPHAKPHAKPDADAAVNPSAATIEAVLINLRQRARRVLLVQRASALLAALLGAAFAAGLIDYAARLPRELRVLAWLAVVAALVYAVRRWILPAWRFAPVLTEIALRLGDDPSDETREVLASAIDLSHAQTSSPTTAWMQSRVIERATIAAKNVDPSAILQRTTMRKSAAAATLALATVAVLFALQPTLATIGATRVLAPWSLAAWPKVTAVTSADAARVHPLGSALPMRALLTRTDRREGQTTVAARYRLIVDGQRSQTQRVLLTSQGRRATSETGQEGELYERLIEPSLLIAAAQDASNARIEFWFETSDNRSDIVTIALIEPPVVEQASAVITVPDYSQSAIDAGAPFAAGTIELGAGSDSRAVVDPVLAGSTLDLTITLNKPLPKPTAEDRAAWAKRTLGDATLASSVTAWGDEGVIRLTRKLDESLRIPVVLIDEYGIASAEESVFAFESVPDADATAAVTDPPEDEAVLATAQIGLVGEGRDDVGVGSISLETVIARPPSGSIGAPASITEAATEIARESFTAAPMQAQISTVLDLSSLSLNAGDEVRVTAIASDLYTSGAIIHEPGRSSVRTLRIISEDDLVEQIRRGLAGVRASAIRLHEQQQGTIEQTQQDGATEENRAAQAGLTEQLGAQRDAIDQLAARAGRNNLGDETLSGLLDDATEALARAAERSDDAQTEMTTGRPTPQLTEEESTQTTEAQQDVEDELEQLIEMLDRGEDSWLSRRSIERLLQEQRALMAQTEAAATQTIGRSVGELSPQEQSLLDAIAQRQSELAENAAEAMQDLQDRSEQMAEVDPAQAEAMAQAAQRGERSQVEQSLEQAAQDIAQNRTQQGQQQQQAAAQALEEMLEELDNAGRNRDQALRRVLASAIESIESLVKQQENELGLLQQAMQTENLDAGMIRLHQNTLGVAGELVTSFRELAPVATILNEASDAQSSAITDLREADANDAEASEMESLDALNRALAEAEKLDAEAAQREQDRKLEELRSAYRDMLEQQVAIRAETRPFEGLDLARRQRAQVRGLGGRQETLRKAIAQLPEQYEELSEATVFEFAHRRIDEALAAVSESLQAATVNRSVIRRQDSAVRLLRSLVTALEEIEQEQDDFREGEQEGAGAGGGSGQPGEEPMIPPMKELLLLRAMQQEAADLTKALNDDASAAPDEVNDVAQMQRELAGQAKDLIERLQNQSPQGQPPTSPGDKPDTTPDPDESPGGDPQ
jgi:archaellum component FlaC